jgi:hypothetical protein
MNEGSSEIPQNEIHQEASELDRRKQGLRDWVEHRVLGKNESEDSGTPDSFAEFSPREKTDLLYSKLMAYTVTDRIIQEEKKANPNAQPEPIDPYLVSEIKGLWEDEQTQEMFTSRFAEARLDAKTQRQSELGSTWQDINERIDDTREAYEAGVRQLFLKQMKRPDRISAAQGRSQRFAKELIKLHDQKDAIIHLEGLPHTVENTDIAAGIMHDTLVKYHEQAKEGFVWLPSREKIHDQTIASLQNGRWPVLRGEAGTGKSEQADAAAVALTEEQPTHLAAGPNTSNRELIADRDIDPETGGGYEIYGAAMQAATGYEDSRQQEPKFKTGRVFRVDESGRMGQKGYSEVKELRQKKPATPEDIKKRENGESIESAKLLHGKPVLPGFSAIFTTNPEGARYPDRNEPDPALRRELSYINVDYPDMTKDNPELYEFMLATLMDENNHIPVPKEELAPAYRKEHPIGKMLPDGRKILEEQYLIDNPTYKEHGSLYRLAFAVRSLQDAFNYGNMGDGKDIPDDALRGERNAEGKLQVVENGGERITLESSTITLGEVASWMKGFHERRLKDDPAYQVDTMTEWLQVKLKGYMGQVDEEDRGKVQAILEHYHLFDPPPDLKDAQPILPKEIGYLSPRVPRPVAASNAVDRESEATSSVAEKTVEPKMYEDITCMLEDGTDVKAELKPLEFEKDGKKIRLKNGRRFLVDEDKFRFVGFAPDNDKVIVRIDDGHKDEALHKIMDIRDLMESGEFKNQIEDREEEYWSEKLGVEVEVPEFPEDIDTEVVERLSEDPENMGIRALPKLDIGTLADLKSMGVYDFLARIQQRYPGLRVYETLNDTEKQDPAIARLPQQEYWQWIQEGRVDFPEEYAKGGWLATELTPKLTHERFHVSWEQVNRALSGRKNSEIVSKFGLPPDRQARMLKVGEFNLLANREGWGQTSTDQWLQDEYRAPGGSYRLIAGHSGNGGAARFDRYIPSGSHPVIGWRAAVDL